MELTREEKIAKRRKVKRNRNILFTCMFLLLIFMTTATVFLLISYQNEKNKAEEAMNQKAEIEQQGYLSELYNMPKNSYVAELFGEVLIVNDKKYRPENIKIYKKNTNNALQCMILNVKFNKGYNELSVLMYDTTLVVYDYHRLNLNSGEYVYIDIGVPLNI